MAYEYLKSNFGDKAISFSDFTEKLDSSKDIKLVNLSEGKYVDKQKLDDKTAELSTANQTITDLQATVKKFDGVDVDSLNNQITTLKEKYDKDTLSLKLDSAVQLGLISAKAKNPKLAKAALDMSIIKLDGDNVVGLEEQLAKLKTSDGYLFEDEKSNENDNKDNKDEQSAGRAGSGAGHQTHNGADNDELSDEDYYNKICKKEQ